MDQPPSESIGELLGRLIEDTREATRAEVALYRAQILGWIAQAKIVATYGIVALLLVNSAVIALFVGLLLILQRHVGPIWATIIVVVSTLLIAGMFGWLAVRHIRQLISQRMPK